MQMKTINWKYAIYFIIGIFVIIFLFGYWGKEETNIFPILASAFSKTITISTLLSTLFCTYFWKCKIFRNWLVLIPNINGKWVGEIESTWIDPSTNKPLAPIDAELTIRQSLFSISCVMKTGEMVSRSCSANLTINSENQISQLVYTYLSTPKQTLQENSRIHYGTALLDLEGGYDVILMSGMYWTGRNTSGNICLTRQL